MSYLADLATSGSGVLRVTAKAHPQDSRRANRSLLAQTLFTRGPMSRADLARITGLARPSVSKVIAQLEAEGLVSELEAPAPHVPGKAGKKGTLIGLRDGLQVVALDLSAGDRIIGARTDLRGRVLEQHELPFDGAAGEEAVARVLELVRALTAAGGPVMGIGVAAPGIVDGDGVVRMGVRLKWYDVAIAERITAETGIPAYAGNDSQAVALGVHAFLSPSDAPRRSLMVVTIEEGVGTGFILDGSLIQGSHFAAGEIGHVTVDPHGPLCECGRLGCLDALVSAKHLQARIDAADPAAKGEILHEAGQALGLVLAPIVSALDLDEVIVCGPPALVEGAFLRAVFTTVRGRNLAAVSHGIAMKYAGSGHELALMGATALVLSKTLGIA